MWYSEILQYIQEKPVVAAAFGTVGSFVLLFMYRLQQFFWWGVKRFSGPEPSEVKARLTREPAGARIPQPKVRLWNVGEKTAEEVRLKLRPLKSNGAFLDCDKKESPVGPSDYHNRMPAILPPDGKEVPLRMYINSSTHPPPYEAQITWEEDGTQREKTTPLYLS